MKHIMLLFLSEVHLNDDRTLSVSRYHHLDGTMIYCVQTNESAVRRTADLLKSRGRGWTACSTFQRNERRKKSAISTKQGMSEP